jgi:hypothetical protein
MSGDCRRAGQLEAADGQSVDCSNINPRPSPFPLLCLVKNCTMAFPVTSVFGRDQLTPHVPGETPLAGKVISAILSMVTIAVLTACFCEGR